MQFNKDAFISGMIGVAAITLAVAFLYFMTAAIWKMSVAFPIQDAILESEAKQNTKLTELKDRIRVLERIK